MREEDGTKEARLRRIRSADGTDIAFFQSGSGPPLVLVHGALMDHTAWDLVVPFLAPWRTVYAPDRRGRGASASTAPYAVEREIEDVAALLNEIGEPIELVGHSSGAILAIQAAERGLPIRRLVLYEPPLIVSGQRSGLTPGLPGRLAAMAAAGDRAGAVQAFLKDGPLLSDEDIETMRARPSWVAQVALADTVAYDAAIVGEYALDRERLGLLRTPTLLLVGGASPAWVRSGTEALDAFLPASRLDVLPEQGHFAIYSAPDMLARKVRQFVDSGLG